MKARSFSINPGPVWVYVISFGALFARFGYNFAAGDQDELIPLLQSMLDPTLFRMDWFVQMQSAEVGVRTYVVWLLFPFSRILSVPIVVFGMYLVSWILVGSGAYRLALKINGSRAAAAAAVFLGLGVLHKWTLGSNDLTYSMFVGEMLAWGLALHALYYWLDRRDFSAALLLGFAAWFQMLVGLLLAGMLLTERLWDRAATRSFAWHRNHDFMATGLFLIAAMPAIIPVAIQQLDALSVDPDLVFYILAPFRNPFHHMISSFDDKAIIRFLSLLAAATVAALYLGRRGELNEKTRLVRFVVAAIVTCIVTAIFTEVWPVLIIAKFQAYKLTVVLKFLFLVVVAAAVVTLLPDRLSRGLDGLLKPGAATTIASLVAVIVVVALAAAKPSFLEARLLHDLHMRSDLGRMETWIRDNTDKDAVFAIPPDNSTFRSNALRAIVINYPAFPFDDVDMVVWYDRLTDIAPVDPPASGLGIKPVLNEAYHDQPADAWVELADKYDIAFLLVDESRLLNLYPFEAVHREGSWTLYHLSEQ